jgi:hypothetical protein
VTNGRKYARRLNTAANENVEEKKTNTESRNTEKNGSTANKTKKKPKDCTQLRFVSAAQKEGDRGVPTQTETPRKRKDREEKEDTCTEFRFISAAQEQGKVSSQPVSPCQCALPLNVART